MSPPSRKFRIRREELKPFTYEDRLKELRQIGVKVQPKTQGAKE